MEHVNKDTLQALVDLAEDLEENRLILLEELREDVELTYADMDEDPDWDGTTDADDLGDSIGYLRDAESHLRDAARAIMDALGD